MRTGIASAAEGSPCPSLCPASLRLGPRLLVAPNLGRGGEQDHYERGDDGVGGDRAEEQATEDGAGGRANGHDGEEAAVVVQDGEVAVAAVAGERDQHRGQDTASDRLPAVLM